MSDHPVWHVYDELRLARLNAYYYRARLGRAQSWHTTRELVIAAAGSTAVAGLWIFATAAGGLVWKGLASISALLAVYHSVARPSERIRKLEAHVTAWALIELALDDLQRRIHEAGHYDKPLQREVKSVLERKQKVVTELIETNVDRSLLLRCFEQVNRELPADRFFVPNNSNGGPNDA